MRNLRGPRRISLDHRQMGAAQQGNADGRRFAPPLIAKPLCGGWEKASWAISCEQFKR